MPTYEDIKKYYEKGLWNKTMVKMAVKQRVITPEQYEEIVEESYPG